MNHKKLSRILLFLGLIIAVCAAGAFFVSAHFKKITTSEFAPQRFSGKGYSLDVPLDWRIEKNGEYFITSYPPITSGDVGCKVEMSAFSYSSSTNMDELIADRIGADKSLTIVEHSTQDISVRGGSAIKWIGTIDDTPMSLIYAFGDHNAYEIASSRIIAPGTDLSICGNVADQFLSYLTIQ
jgi:hypothetical protein